MCKKSLLMMLLLALFAPWAAKAQTTVEIGDGTGTTYYFPIDNYFNYSCTQQIYTADEIGTAGNITAVSFYYNYGTAYTASNVTMYMKNVERSDFSSTTDCEALALDDIVWTGSIAPTEAGWYTFELDTPFEYDGTSNLLVAFFDGTSGYPGTSYTWRQTTSPNSAYMALRYYSDSSCPDPYNLSSYGGSKQRYTYRTNIQINITPGGGGPTCAKPTGVAVETNGLNAVFTWNSEATSFDIAHSMDASANPDNCIVGQATTNSYEFNNLELGDHYVWVRANCGSDGYSSWTSKKSFHIGYCVPAPSSVDNNGISNVTFGMGDYVVNNDTPKATYADYSTLVGAVPAGVESTIAITFKTGYTYNTFVWVDLDNSLSFDPDEVVCYGESTSSNPTTLTLNFTIPPTQTLGDFRLRIGSADSGLGSDPANANPCYTGSYGCFQDYTLRVLEAPSCLPPTGVAVSNVAGHVATISWTSDASTWQIGYSTDGFVTENYVEVTENPYTLTGLNPETTYQVRVQTNCGSGVYSVFTNPVSFTTTVACPAPTVAVDNITTTTADVTCTNTEASEFNLQLINPNVTPADTTTFANVTMPYPLTGLTQDKSYKVRVQAICGGEDGESAWSSVVTFTTAEECPEGMVCIGTGKSTNSYLPTYTYYNYSLTQQIYTAAEIGGAGAIMSIDFYSTATERTRTLDIYMVMTDKASFASTSDYIAVTASDLVYSGSVTFVQDDWTTIQLNTPFAYADDTQNVALIVHDKTGGYVSSPSFRVFSATDMALYAYNDNYDYVPSTPGTYSNGTYTFTKTNVKNRVRLVMGEIVDCDMPTNLAVSDITMESANLTWTAGGSETAWQVCINGDESNLIDVTSNAYQLTNLTGATTYTVKVRANCGSGQSYWTPEISFNTAICDAADQCEISYTFSVSSGTSWHTASFDVVDVDTDIVIANLTYNADAPTGTIAVCEGHQIKFVYNSAQPTSYNSYNSYTFKDVNEEEIFSGTGAMSEPYIYTVNCTVTSCRKPTELTATNAYGHGATLNWTENADATEWIVAYKTANEEEFTEVSVSEKPYTLTGLVSETAYSVKVRPVCDVDNKWSSIITFSTTVACTAPTGITASNITGHGVTMTWTAEEGAWYQYQMIKTDAYDPENINWSASFEGNTLSWDNLNPETGYTFALRKDCSEAEDGYSQIVTRTFTTLVACPAPTVAVSNITATTADLSCTNTEAELFNVLVVNDSTLYENVAMPYTLTDLIASTSYTVKVRAICGDDGESEWSSGTTFMTADICPDGMVCIGAGTSTNNYIPTYTFYNYSLTQQIYTAAEIGEAGAIFSVDFYKSGTNAATRNLDIYMVNTEKTSFSGTTDWITVTSSDLVFSGEVTFADNDWTTIEFDVPFLYDGNTNVAFIVDDNTGSYVSSPSFYAFSATSQAIRVYSDGTNYDPYAPTSYSGTVLNQKNRIRFAIGEPPACPKPTGLAVNYEGGTSATFTWTENGTATSWDLQYDTDPDFTNPVFATVNDTTTYELTGLSLATTYYVRVNAFCDAPSDYSNTVSFTTDFCMPENMCEITIVLTDAYGDGGGKIQVVDKLTEEVLGTYTNSGASATYTLAVCDGRPLIFVYTSTDSWSYENGWLITDINGEVITEHEGCSDSGNCTAPTNGVIAEYVVSCAITTCRRPTNLAVTEVGPHSAMLSWTENGEATEWVVEITDVLGGQFTVWNASTNPYTIVGLEPETDYSVRVRPVCSDFDDKWSTAITFTTDIACPKPYDLTITPYPFTANVEWSGFGESYTIEWVEAPATRDGLWLQYDNGTQYTNIGGNTEGYRNWGVRYPAEMLEGNNTLTKVAVMESSYYVDTIPYTINIYSGDTPETGTLVGTETVNPTGTQGMREITLSTPATINPAQSLWITLTAYGTYMMPACTVNNPDNQWWDNNADGIWTNMGEDNANLAPYGWMIRGYVEGYDASAWNWNSETGVTSPYTIEGLEAETTYAVKVQANCGNDGESGWIWAYFTTPSACDAPVDLTAEDITYNAATLNWVGYQESYNLRYRHVIEGDPTAPATIILEAHDVWQDGSGYQMLFDADATAFGVLWNANHYILVDGEQYSSGDLPAEYYDEFEYKIPTEADGSLSTTNIVMDGSVTITIPAGTYDYIILNPTPGDRFYIAADNGEVPCVGDDFVFEPGVTYHFTMQQFSTGDGAAFEIIRPMNDWTVVENVTTPYELTGLIPETYYEFQVQGINPSCTETEGLTEWSEIASFTAAPLPTQTIALAAGNNWISCNIEITLSDLRTALQAASPDNAITVKSQTQSLTYNPSNHRWTGRMDWNLANMYLIKVQVPCEITFQGYPINPEDHPATIANGANWIAYPLNENMTLTNAFAGFAVSGDKVKSQTNDATYSRRWSGQLTTLVPGQGYIYKSNATSTRTFVFPAGNRQIVAPETVQPQPRLNVNPTMVKMPRTIDMFPTKN